MATINLSNPFDMSTGVLLTLGTNNYEKAISTARITSDVPSSEFRAVSGDVYSFSGKPSRSVTITFAQDWETEDSLSNYLLEHETEKEDMTLKLTSGGPTFNLTGVSLVSGDIGGDVNAPATASVTMKFDALSVTPAA